MKKFFLFFFLICLTIASCSKPQTNAARAGLKGDVQSFTECTYTSKSMFGEYVKDSLIGIVYYDYDKKGRLIRMRALNEDTKWVYTEDSVIYTWTSEGELVTYSRNKLNSKGCIENETEYRKDGTISRIIKRDVNGNITESTSFNPDGTTIFSRKNSLFMMTRIIYLAIQSI